MIKYEIKNLMTKKELEVKITTECPSDNNLKDIEGCIQISPRQCQKCWEPYIKEVETSE